MLRYTDEELFDIAASVSLSEVAGQYCDLRPSGHQMQGCCPFHHDHTPSFYVDDAKGLFHCFGCEAKGNVFQFIQKAEAVDFLTAVERVASGFVREATPARTPKPKRDTVAGARDLWSRAQPLWDSPAVMKYLENRGLDNFIERNDDFLRFAELPFDGSARHYPALVVPVRDIHQIVQGVQITYLNDEGQKIAEKNCRRSWGNISGNAVHLYNDLDLESNLPKHLFLCEGVEDGLSLIRMGTKDVDMHVWACAGAGLMRNIKLPDSCNSVTIVMDNDAAGRHAAHALDKRLSAEGVEVDIIHPREDFKDFNAELCYWQFNAPEGVTFPWADVD